MTIQLGDVMPGGCEFVRPLTFVSCRSTTTHGNIRDLTIERLCERPNFARVRANVDIPIDVVFCDAAGHQGTGRAILTVRKDVILYVPDESIIPFSVESIVGAICVSGEYCGDLRFNVTICVTVILKIVAEVELLIPSYGFCQIPPCEEFAENVSATSSSDCPSSRLSWRIATATRSTSAPTTAFPATTTFATAPTPATAAIPANRAAAPAPFGRVHKSRCENGKRRRNKFSAASF